MSQATDYTVDNSTGANVRADINAIFGAVATNNSGGSDNGSIQALGFFANTSTSKLQLKNAAGNAFINLRGFDGSLPLPDGSASSPSLFFDDDTNTGVFSNGADEFNIATGGTSRISITTGGMSINDNSDDFDIRIEGNGDDNLVRIDAGNDRVGIGTSSPQNDFHLISGNTDLCKLESNNTGSTGPVLILFHSTSSPADNDIVGTLSFRGKDSAGNETTFADIRGNALDVTNGTEDGELIFNTTAAGGFGERMRLNPGGRLLLGTSTTVNVGAPVGALYQIETTSQNAISCVAHRGTSNTSGSILILAKSRGTSAGSANLVANGDELGAIRFAGADGTDLESRGGEINCVVDGSTGSDDMPAKLQFKTTADGASTATTRMVIDSSGDVIFYGTIRNNDVSSALNISGGNGADSSANIILNGSSGSPANVTQFRTGSTDRMRINATGRVSINTTNTGGRLTINSNTGGHYTPGGSGGIAQNGIHIDGNHGNSGERGGAISFSAGGGGACAIAARNESTDRDQIGMEFFTHNNSDEAVQADRRLRISVGGAFYFGNQDINDPANNNSVGVSILDTLGMISVCRNSDIPLVVGVTGSDFQLIRFLAQGSIEGNIAVSGSTVSYNGGHLSRWSQIKGISTTDKSARPTIYQGTVMSNLDDLCVWSYPDQFYTEQDKTDDQIPEGKKVGDLKKAAHTEENQQLNMTKISDTEGDKNVAGVFWTWDDANDDYYTNDFYIAMTGDMVIRVAASTTVARGDLMISAGDGTAKPQADDIIRSSTIAKIISTNATATYADGSKAYPCVLMAC